jgi:hypothetical protein
MSPHSDYMAFNKANKIALEALDRAMKSDSYAGKEAWASVAKAAALLVEANK